MKRKSRIHASFFSPANPYPTLLNRLWDRLDVAAGSAITVPDKNGHTLSTYKFSWWDLNGTRKQDPSGAALGQFSFVLNVPATATAHYYDPAADTDNDTISDWHE